MKFDPRNAVLSLVIASAASAALAGCTFSTSSVGPVGRSSTTGAVLCPAGYEPSRDGSCLLTPSSAQDQNAFR